MSFLTCSDVYPGVNDMSGDATPFKNTYFHFIGSHLRRAQISNVKGLWDSTASALQYLASGSIVDQVDQKESFFCPQ